jgi:hypothetical protein
VNFFLKPVSKKTPTFEPPSSLLSLAAQHIFLQIGKKIHTNKSSSKKVGKWIYYSGWFDYKIYVLDKAEQLPKPLEMLKKILYI